MNRTYLSILIIILFTGIVSCNKNRFRARLHTDDMARMWSWRGENKGWVHSKGTAIITVTDTIMPIIEVDNKTVEFMGRKFEAPQLKGKELDKGEVQYFFRGDFDHAELRFFYKKDSVIYTYINSRSSHSNKIVLTGKRT